MQNKRKAEADSKHLVCMATNLIWNSSLTTQIRFIERQIWDQCANYICFLIVFCSYSDFETFFVIYVLGSWRADTCSCVRVRTHMCGSVISSSFKSCHRPDTIVRRAFHRLTSDVPVIQSNYTERNRYCYTLGIDSRQNRKVEIRLQPSTAMWTWSLNTPHLLPAQIWNHMDEQLQSLGDNKSSRWLTSVLGGQFWQAAFSNLK